MHDLEVCFEYVEMLVKDRICFPSLYHIYFYLSPLIFISPPPPLPALKDVLSLCKEELHVIKL